MPPKKQEEVECKAARFGRVKNNLKMGIVGLPNVGKSSLFNLLCERSIPAENFPFCTIDPNESRCAVPDERFDYLVEMFKPASVVPSFLFVTDIAGLVKGASTGAGLGNAFLSHIQAVDGIFHVVRAFDNDEVTHVDDSVDPVRDLETIQHELCQKDLEFVEKALQAEQKSVRGTPGYKLSPLFNSTFDKLKNMLENDKPIVAGDWTNSEVDLINEKVRLITSKPVVYLVNLSKKDYIRKKNKWLPKIHKWVQEHGGGTMIPFSVEFEQELWDLREDAAGLEALLKEAEGAKSALPKMITTGYHELNLIHFMTAGQQEVRCWTVFNGAVAPQAAGVIHSDFERGFIKAEVCAYDDFKALATGPSMNEVKAGGKYRQEGKSYVVKDGDIIHFMFNVTAQKKK